MEEVTTTSTTTTTLTSTTHPPTTPPPSTQPLKNKEISITAGHNILKHK